MSLVYLTEPGIKVQKKGGRYIVTKEHEIVLQLPANTVDGILLIDKVQVTSEAMVDFLQKGIPVSWISSHGKLFGRLSSTWNVNVLRQAKQIQIQHTKFTNEMQRNIVLAKIHNQLTLLRRNNRKTINERAQKTILQLDKLQHSCNVLKSSAELMGYEGIAAKYYFQALGEMVPDEFSFTKRSKHPPQDAFNSMLSFGYTLLMFEIYTAVTNEGLHPYFGFAHQLKAHHPALVSDLIEEWRVPIIDSMVLSLVRKKMISIEAFDCENMGVYLNHAGRKIFLQEYETRMSAKMHQQHTYRDLLLMQASAYAHALMTEDAMLYKPYKMR